MKNNRADVIYLDIDLPIADLDNDLWSKAEPIRIKCDWSGDAASHERHFKFRCVWTDATFYMRFDAEQHEPLVVNPEPDLTKKTMELWHRDVCELFIAPDRNVPQRYAEFEIAPTGEWLDLMVDWRDDEPRDWNFNSGMTTAARVENDSVLMAFAVPWEALETKPSPGDIWLGNVFRQVGSGETRGYLAWQPTLTEQPNFHVPEAFGEFHFIR